MWSSIGFCFIVIFFPISKQFIFFQLKVDNKELNKTNFAFSEETSKVSGLRVLQLASLTYFIMTELVNRVSFILPTSNVCAGVFIYCSVDRRLNSCLYLNNSWTKFNAKIQDLRWVTK